MASTKGKGGKKKVKLSDLKVTKGGSVKGGLSATRLNK